MKKRRKKSRKAQAAMEYLMTYGWAILIIIVVVAALYAMGVFTVSPGVVACSPCFSNFAFIDYASGTLIIRNGPQDIAIASGGITSTPAGATTTDCDPAVANCTSGEVITVTSIPITGDVDLIIAYTVVDSGLPHTDTAVIHNS